MSKKNNRNRRISEAETNEENNITITEESSVDVTPTPDETDVENKSVENSSDDVTPEIKPIEEVNTEINDYSEKNTENDEESVPEDTEDKNETPNETENKSVPGTISTTMKDTSVSDKKFQIIFVDKGSPLQIQKTLKRLRAVGETYEYDDTTNTIKGKVFSSYSDAISHRKYLAGKGLKPILREL